MTVNAIEHVTDCVIDIDFAVFTKYSSNFYITKSYLVLFFNSNILRHFELAKLTKFHMPIESEIFEIGEKVPDQIAFIPSSETWKKGSTSHAIIHKCWGINYLSKLFFAPLKLFWTLNFCQQSTLITCQRIVMIVTFNIHERLENHFVVDFFFPSSSTWNVAILYSNNRWCF